MTKKNLSRYCDLETPSAEGVFVCIDGSYMSIAKIAGSRKVVGRDELNKIVEDIANSWKPFLAEPGHGLQFFFSRDQDHSSQLVSDILQSPERVAQRLGLSLEDLFEERKQNLPKYITLENIYVGLWTRLSVLPKNERETAKKDLAHPKIIPHMRDAQKTFLVGSLLKERHTSFVSSFIQDLSSAGMSAKLLDCRDALKAMKWSIHPNMQGSSWLPTLPGDPIPRRTPFNPDDDISYLLWPRIEPQLFDREAEQINSSIVRIGSQYFGSLDMIVGPQDVKPFSNLLHRLIDLGDIPWRMSFKLEAADMTILNVKSTLASLFQFSNSYNSQIRTAVEELDAAHKDGTVLAKLRVSFTTWAPVVQVGNIKEIETRLARLQRAVEGWGYMQVSSYSGDPIGTTMSTNIGLHMGDTAPSGVAPLEDIVELLPWGRDASPFEKGSVLFRTSDGRPWPYEPGTSVQNAFIDLFVAPPGRGKSVLLNALNLSLSLSASAVAGSGKAELPRISIIDIGPSSSGLISLLKESLPANRQHEVAYHRLQMTPKFSINPFDTQLGCRHPFPAEKSFIQNFLTTLGTEAGETNPPQGLGEAMSTVIDELYIKYDDNPNTHGQPKRYIKGANPVVDYTLDQHNIKLEHGNKTTWWDVVDALFSKNEFHKASVAQRYAVPILEDVMSILQEGAVTDIHRSAKTKTGETVLDACKRMISTSIRALPIISHPTVFDVSTARIISLDIDMVAPRGGPAADKQTNLMYMLARSAVARDFHMDLQLLPTIPRLYRTYHERRMRRMKETPKRLVFDEFHRTANAKSVRDQVAVDIREGRKYGIQIALSSQLLGDFDDNIIRQSTARWILGTGDEADLEDAQKRFKLSNTALKILRNKLTGPRKGGAPLLLMLDTKKGSEEHLLYNTLGPTELWAFSTTAEDTALRDILYSKLGPQEARNRLAKRFPGGSAKPEIEKRKVAYMDQSESLDEELDAGIIEGLVEEMCR
ncbi:ATP-binding protein [Flexibacterium corallicola]|uniref:ATP-binding protein n=1 Tax=Flexibacterium corallicola TaxID=3037259 RepID=UPI00286F0544|nr:ATP-binding protein [Pseudovibrio sp. M1P-2-3]